MGSPASLPPPYTGLKHLTKKVQTEAEYVETKARFLAVIAGAGEWATIRRELGDLNGLSVDEIMRRGPAPYRVSARLDQKQDEILGEPAWKKQPQAEPVYSDAMIPKWRTNTVRERRVARTWKQSAACLSSGCADKHPERQDHNDMADTMPMKRPKRNLAANVSGAP